MPRMPEITRKCGRYKEYLTANQYFMCLVDGVPYDADWDYINERFECYVDDWYDLIGNCDFEVVDVPYDTLQDYIWSHSRKAVPRPTDIPLTFGWDWEPTTEDFELDW